MKRKLRTMLLISSVSALTFMGGCSCIPGAGGADFDIKKFLTNPIVLIIIGIIVFFMMKHKK
jgi:hypothetical protein